MQFSDPENNNGLIQDITFLTGLDTNAISLAERTRLINRHYYLAVIEAWKADPYWEFDDPNLGSSQSNNNWTYSSMTGLPIATRDLVNNTRFYSLPTNALAIERVEVLNAQGVWQLLKPITKEEIGVAVSEFHKPSGMPIYYNLVGTNIELIPAPSSSAVTLTGGLKAYLSREIYEFAPTDTTKEPALPEPFHRLLSLGAAYDIAMAKGLSNAQLLKIEYEQLMQKMRNFFGRRHSEKKVRIKISKSIYI